MVYHSIAADGISGLLSVEIPGRGRSGWRL